MKPNIDESIIDIDLYQLHKEWLEQASKVLHYGSKLADAKFEHAELKAELEICQADAANSIRSNPEKYGLEKTTIDTVRDKVTVDVKVIDTQVRMNQAKHTIDQLEAVVNALEHRKKALENLVVLEGREYFAAPREPKEAEVREKMDQAKMKECTVPNNRKAKKG